MRDDRDELQMPLMPSRKDHQGVGGGGGGGGSGSGGGGGTKASVVVTVLPTDGPSAYAPTSSLRLIREPSSSSQSQPPRRPSSTCSSSGADGRTSANRKKSSANGGFAIKSPSKSVRSSETGKTSAQVRSRQTGFRCYTAQIARVCTCMFCPPSRLENTTYRDSYVEDDVCAYRNIVKNKT